MDVTRRMAIVAVACASWTALQAVGAPGRDDPPPRDQSVKPRPHPAPLGLRVAALSTAQARADGLTVVHATGTAYDSGLRVGDLIVEVDGRAVADEPAFWDALEAADWKPTLAVLRAGRRLTIQLAPAPSAP